MKQRTFCMLKPDAVARRLIGRILKRFEAVGLKIVAMKLVKLSKETAEKNYSIHKGKPFYEPLIRYVTSGPVVCMVLEGEDAVALVRKLVGATKPLEAAAGTIRGDFGQRVDFNIIHASDALETAQREIPVFFDLKEIVDYDLPDEKLI